MTLKKMVQTYVNFECDPDVWKMISMMHLTGLITYEQYNKFYEKCKGYTFNKDDRTVRDENDMVIADHSDWIH